MALAPALLRSVTARPGITGPLVENHLVTSIMHPSPRNATPIGKYPPSPPGFIPPAAASPRASGSPARRGPWPLPRAARDSQRPGAAGVNGRPPYRHQRGSRLAWSAIKATTIVPTTAAGGCLPSRLRSPRRHCHGGAAPDAQLAVDEHRCPRPERSLGELAVARDQVGGKDAVGDEPLAFAVEARCQLAGAPAGPWRQRRVVQRPGGGTRRGPRGRRRGRWLAEVAECRPRESGERERGRLAPQDLI